MTSRGQLIEREITFVLNGRNETGTFYDAKHEKLGLRFSGVSGVDADVRRIIRRMIEARNNPPEGVASVVSSVIESIRMMVNSGAQRVTVSIDVDLGGDEMLVIWANAKYVEDYVDGLKGWRVSLGVKFMGPDGYDDGAEHEVSKSIIAKELDFAALDSELRTLARMAYNAHA
jgi:hypothetical protein